MKLTDTPRLCIALLPSLSCVVAAAPTQAGPSATAAPNEQARAAQVVNDLAPALSDCTRPATTQVSAGLNHDHIVLTLDIDPAGAVTSVAPAEGSPFPSEVTACLTTVFQKARFDPPGPNGSTIQVPIHLLTTRGPFPQALFRQCYDAALAKDPSLAGQVDVVTTLQPTGDVRLSVSVKPGSKLPPPIRECLVMATRKASADGTTPPTGP